jgi:hypothetical protein
VAIENWKTSRLLRDSREWFDLNVMIELDDRSLALLWQPTLAA